MYMEQAKELKILTSKNDLRCLSQNPLTEQYQLGLDLVNLLWHWEGVLETVLQ